MSEQTCAICEAALPPRKDNPTFPFCSYRCRMLDLARWLDGDYRIPAAPDAADGDGPDELDLLAAQAMATLAEDELPS